MALPEPLAADGDDVGKRRIGCVEGVGGETRDLEAYTKHPQDPGLNEAYRRAASEAWAELPW